MLACSNSAGSVHLRLVSTNDWEHAANTDLGVTNEFYGVGEFANNAVIMMLDYAMKSCEKQSFRRPLPLALFFISCLHMFYNILF